MKISARNTLNGAVMTEIVVEIAGGTEVVAVITKGSADTMQLSAGKEVYAVIKATEVMIMTD